jgi:hypothetical protein
MLRTTGEGFLACKRERENKDRSIVGKLFDAEAKNTTMETEERSSMLNVCI